MSDARFIDFDIVDVPPLSDALEQWAHLLPDDRSASRSLLVLYQKDDSLDFLISILKAAGYQQPGNQCYLLPWPADNPLDLAALVRSLRVERVLLFGQSMHQLGLRLRLAPYVAVRLSGVYYLTADSLSQIQKEKEAGKTQKAAALWKAIKNSYLYKPDPA